MAWVRKLKQKEKVMSESKSIDLPEALLLAKGAIALTNIAAWVLARLLSKSLFATYRICKRQTLLLNGTS